ncbi:hypothetical protein NFI96_005136 [Prochilodus magdalenae]|nr:hypothetical protein NFI96_005136 [Prochilodus magdalenae]
MTSIMYVEFLKQHLLPWFKKKNRAFPSKIIFMHDNAPSHAAKNTSASLAAMGIKGDKLMVWPPCSPDLNPIENLWSIIKRSVYDGGRQFTSKQQLWEVSEDLRVVLLGNAGVGKSATANALLGQEAFRETETTECKIQRGRVDSRNISVIDTPGLNTRTLSTDQLKTEIEKCLSLSAPGPHIFLLVIRLRTFTEDQRNTVKWIQENMGEEALRFTMVLFTGKEELTNRQWTSFSQDVKMTELTDNCGFGYDVINSKREANPAQITKLLEKIETMTQQNGGQYYTPEKRGAQNERSTDMEYKGKEADCKQRTEIEIHAILMQPTSTRDNRALKEEDHPETLTRRF